MKKSPARNLLLKKAPSKLLERINSSIDVDARLFQEDIEASVVHCRMLVKTKITKIDFKIFFTVNYLILFLLNLPILVL